jgi:hypothetical protein
VTSLKTSARGASKILSMRMTGSPAGVVTMDEVIGFSLQIAPAQSVSR